MPLSLALVFLAGVLTIVTPCILPILPPMLAGSVGHRLRPVFIVLGSSVAFTFMGGLFSAFGTAVSFKETLRFLMIFMIIAFGAVMADEDISKIYTRYSSRLADFLSGTFRLKTSASAEHPLLSAFVLGLSLGVVWIPCVGPILGTVLSYATYQGELAYGSLLLFVYSLGLGIPMLAIAYGGKHAAGKLEWARRNYALIRKAAGIIMILSGLAILFGIDRYLQAALLPLIPKWALGLL